MRKRPVTLLAGMFLIGILWKRTGLVWLCGIGLLLYLYMTPWKERGARFVVLAVGMPLILILGAFCIGQQEAFRDAYLTELSEGQTVRLAGKLHNVEEKTHCYYYYLTDCYVERSGQSMPCNDVLAFVSSDDVSVGQILILQGTITLFDEAANEGQFDAQAFYRSQKIDFGVWVDVVERVEGKPDRFRIWLSAVRAKLAIPLERYAKDDGVLSAMLLGDKTSLDSEIKALYQKSGIAHILAISGLHISLLGMSLYRFLRQRCGMTYLWAGTSVTVFLSAYTLMTGNAVSARRAAGMLLVYLAADLLGRAYDMLSALGLIVIVLLWENPFLVTNSGFQFSVAAVLGIGVAQSVLVPRGDKRLSGMLISLSIQLFTIPLVAYYYYEIPVYAILLNIPVLAVVPYVLGLAVAGSLAGQIAFLQPLSFVLCRVCGWILHGYRWLCGVSLMLPGARMITGKPSEVRLIVYYCLLGVFYYVLWCGLRRDSRRVQLKESVTSNEPAIEGRDTQGGVKAWRDKSLPHINGERIRKQLGFVLGIVILLIVLFARGKPEFELDILDVGQGDAIYLCTSDGTSLMIDGGSTDVKGVGTYRILSFLKSKAIRKVSYWFVSHTDEDHISGLVEVMESGYRIENLVLAEAQKEDEKAKQLAELARKNEIRVCYMKADDVLETMKEDTANERNGAGAFRVECLYPGSDNDSEDINDRCLVLSYEDADFSAFFGGDISSEVEEQLVASGKCREADVFKASHHGSKYSNSDALLQTLHPRLTVASAGEKNRYGHPSPDAVKRVEESGSAFFSTIDGGQISVGIVDGKMVVEPYKKIK